MPFARLTHIAALHALDGTWSGSGTWRGLPVELRARGVVTDEGLRLLVTALEEGEIAHAEEARFFATEEGICAVTRPAPEVEQHWKLHAPPDVPGFVLLHGDPDDPDVLRLRWTIAFDGADAYRETFEIAHPGSGYAVDLEARYERAD